MFCAICLEENTKEVKLRCNHGFCRDCIVQALRFNKRCPLCRAPTSLSSIGEPEPEPQEHEVIDLTNDEWCSEPPTRIELIQSTGRGQSTLYLTMGWDEWQVAEHELELICTVEFERHSKGYAIAKEKSLRTAIESGEAIEKS